MVTVYFAGGEDIDMDSFGSGVSTTSGRFRSAYARCALNAGNNGFWQCKNYFTGVSTFWTSGWNFQDTAGGTMTNNVTFMGWRSSDGVQRLAILGANASQTFKVCKINAAGTVTQLGSNFTMNVGGLLSKIDVYIDYGASGTITIYYQTASAGPLQVFTYSGDLTTDGNTQLAKLIVGSPNFAGGNGSFNWSELIVCDTDTRNMSLQTLAPVANGNTHDFDTGTPAAANVNETTLSDATLDGSTTAGQIDQYTIPALATGTFSILAVGMSARMTRGVSGPSKMDFGVRVSGTDYWSSDQSLTLAWASYQYWWSTDPNTSAAWSALPTNIGLKSVT